ncbi:TPA: glycosyltransferase family 4 protein [Vibrio parahaemolyticus]|nr:glycosyltransferase family 4 protein [Vibrio parahaemolyticus]HAV1383159.1 glycosyltransferase family 4 protein [Vibrio parahaemolyticus]
MNVIINASNLHVGGGVQVASSFITELSKLLELGIFSSGEPIVGKYSVVCSTVVKDNLPCNCNIDVFEKFVVADSNLLQIFNSSFLNHFDGFDVCFSIFGPIYPKLRAKYHICGFAQAWIAYPNNEAYSLLSKFEGIKFKINYKIKRYFFTKADHLIVEQQHVRDALVKIGFDDEISVVRNTISSIYQEPSLWESLDFHLNTSGNIVIGFIGRPYVHKNVSVLKRVNEILIDTHGVKIDFLFTFTQEEFSSLGFDEISNFHTVGAISVNQCPSFYNKIDALIFPSLLECFSVSPLEALTMNVPVLASNREFVKEVCGDSALYFEPTDPISIVDAILVFLRNKNFSFSYSHLEHYNAKDRAESYLKIIEKHK